MLVLKSRGGRKPLVAVIFLLLAFFILSSSGGSDPSLPLSPTSAVKAPEIKGEAAFLIEGTTRAVIYEKNATREMAPGSSAGIIIALLALERGDLHSVIEIPGEIVSTTRLSTDLKASEKLSLEELLYAILFNSDDGAAMAVALHLAGAPDKFAKLMTERAQEAGALSTSFITPLDSQLQGGGNYITPRDLALITLSALRNPTFARIVSTPLWRRTSGGEERLLVNGNPLLGRYKGADGVKAGNSGEGKGYMIASAIRNGQRLVAIVVDSTDASADARALLDYGFENYQLYNFANRGDLLKSVSVRDGVKRKVGLVAAGDLNILLPRNLEGNSLEEVVEVRENIEAPIQQWEELGRYRILLDGRELGSVALLSDSQVPRKGIADLLREWFMLFINLFG